MCHLPYAIFSVALAMIILTFLSHLGGTEAAGHVCSHGHAHDHAHGSLAYRLFHNFHFLHILFAATGTMLTFRRYSSNVLKGLLVGFAVPGFFCTLSDALLPYLGGAVLKLPMSFHWCFVSHWDTVLPFLLVGMVNGWVMSSHKPSIQVFYSVWFHFFHIFISSMASILYLVSFGFHDWWTKMGFVFTYMIVVVLIPCTLADIVIPMLFAKIKKK